MKTNTLKRASIGLFCALLLFICPAAWADESSSGIEDKTAVEATNEPAQESGASLNSTPTNAKTNPVRKTPAPKAPAVSASPTHVTATATGDGQVTLTWDAVDGATKYAIAEKLSTGKYRNFSTTYTGTSYVVDNLSNGRAHQFLVQAYVNGTWSPASDALLVSATPTGTVKPTISAVPKATSVKLSWGSVPGATKYAIAVKTDSGYSTYTYKCTSTSYTVTGLNGNTNYQFLVQAYIDGAWSKFTSSDLVSVLTTDMIPRNVSATATGDGEVTLTWDAVDGATKYAIAEKLSTGKYKNFSTVHTATNYIADNLSNEKTHQFLVQAYVEGRWSPASDDLLVSATPTGTVKPTVSAVPRAMKVDLSWDRVPGASRYAVARKTSSGYYNYTLDCTDTTYTVTGLTPQTSYQFLVQAYIDGAWSKFTSSDLVSVLTTDMIPRNVNATPTGDGEVTLTWDAVNYATKYAVAEQLASGKYKTYSYSVEDTNFIINNLSNEKAHTFLVQAYVDGAWSPASQDLLVTATPSGPIKPEVTAQAQDNKVLLSWNAVSGATNYAIAVRLGNGTYHNYSLSCESTNFTVPNLYGGETYTFLVQAYIDGAWSKFDSTDLVTATPSGQTKSDLGIDSESWYEILAASDDSLALTVKGGARKDGANLELDKAQNRHSQLYKFIADSGFYRVYNAITNRIVDITKSNASVKANKTSAQRLFYIVKNDDGSFRFVNLAANKSLDASNGLVKRGQNVVVNLSQSDKVSEAWKLKEVTDLLVNGYYRIVPSYASSRTVTVANGSRSEGANVSSRTYDKGFYQKWKAVRVGANSYTFQSLNSGKYLVVNPEGNVVQSSTTTNGVWTVRFSNGYLVLTNTSTGKVLAVEHDSSSNGADVRGEDFDDSKGQRFDLVTTPPVDNGIYAIHPADNSSKVIGIQGDTTKNGANIRIWKNSGVWSQVWSLSRNSDGSYYFTNPYSKKVFDIDNASNWNGANVKQYTKASSSNPDQRWFIVYDNGFKIVSAVDATIVLNLAGSASNGTNVNVATTNGSSKQYWTFTKAKYKAPATSSSQKMANKANGYSSSTKWLLLVNRSTNRVGIFKGSKGNWSLYKYWSCSTGKKSTPTVKGSFTIKNRGYSFGNGYTCYYWTQFYGNYLFHSVLYYQGTKRVMDGRLGQNLSHGCVRLNISNAKWIYNNIPRGSKVVVY
jgi:lipoprotein-anchoring transpeptidase ErfK/SrfK